MLQTIRDRASGWFAYTIVFLISVPFALWGINHYFEGGSNDIAARVGGKSITLSVYQRAVRQERARVSQMFGGHLPANINKSMIKQAALRQLIQNTLLSQVVKKSGYKVTNHELLKQIMAFPVFQKDGQFSKKQYKAVLENQGLRPSSFEDHLRNEMAIDQFRSGVMNTAFVTSSELNSVLKLENEERKIKIIDIPISAFLAKITVSNKEIKQYYNKNKSQYMTNRSIKLAYLELNINKIKKNISPNKRTLKAFYKKNIKHYVVPKRVKAAEIVLNISDKKDEKARALIKANHIVKLYKHGRKFNKLAHQYSENASATKGGNLGVVKRGNLPAPISKELFSLHPGTISKPVIFGNKLYLLKVDKLLPSYTQSYSTVKSKVRQAYISEQALNEFKHLLNRLSELTYQHPGTLKPASKNLGLKVLHTGWFSKQNSTGIASIPNVLHAAYSKSVLDNGTNSSLIRLSNNKAIVLRVSDKQAPQPKPLKGVKSAIRKHLERQLAESKCNEIASKITDGLQNSRNIQKILSEYHLKLHSVGWVKRHSQKIPSTIIKAAFDVPVPDKKSPSAGKAKLNNGGYAVFTVNQIKWENINRHKEQKMKKNVIQQKAQSEMSILFQDLLHSAKIRIYKNNLNS